MNGTKTSSDENPINWNALKPHPCYRTKDDYQRESPIIDGGNHSSSFDKQHPRHQPQTTINGNKRKILGKILAHHQLYFAAELMAI